MEIKNKIKYSFLIKQLIKSDVEIYCGLFSILCSRTQYGRKTEASLSQTENSAWKNVRIVLSLEVLLPPTLLACKNFTFGQQQQSECFPCCNDKLPGWDLLFLVHKAWDQALLLFVGVQDAEQIYDTVDACLKKNPVSSQSDETEEMEASSRCPRYKEILFQNNPLPSSDLWLENHWLFCIPFSVCLIASSASCGKKFNQWTALILPPTNFTWTSPVFEQE